MCLANREEVIAFLQTMRQRIRSNNNEILIVKREENDKLITDIGLTKELIRDEIILKLSYEDYSKGPEDDRNGDNGKIWIFYKEVWGYGLYVKLKHTTDASVLIKVISLHENRHEMTTPHR